MSAKIVLVLLFFTAVSTASNLSNLKNAIFSDYDKEVDPEEKVTIKFGMHLIDLSYCPKKTSLMDSFLVYS